MRTGKCVNGAIHPRTLNRWLGCGSADARGQSALEDARRSANAPPSFHHSFSFRDLSPPAADVKYEAALPFGLVLCPLGGDGGGGEAVGGEINAVPSSTTPTHARDLGRCASCFAYAAEPCVWGATAWKCALCGRANAYMSSAGARYAHPAARAACPELVVSGVVDLPDGDRGDDDADDTRPSPPGGLPATCIVGLVDVGCAVSALAVAEAARAALAAVAGALPPRARLGVASVSTQLTLFDCREAGAPTGRVVSLLDGDGGPPAPLEVGDALSAPSFLTRLPGGAAGVGAALDALAADAAQGGGGGGCAAGAAVQALLAYLGAGAGEVAASDAGWGSDEEAGAPDVLHPPARPAAHPPPLLGTRLMVFLGGAPSAGRGSSTPAAPPADPSLFWAAAGEAAASLGVVVDLFFLDGRGAGAAALAPLASISGGLLRVFTPDGLADLQGLPSLGDDARLAGLARSLVSPGRATALAAEVRLRVPPSLLVCRSYAGMASSPTPDGHVALPCMRAETSLAFDLEHVPGRNGRLRPGARLVAQAAVRYWRLDPSPQSHPGPPFTARRRLRIISCSSPHPTSSDPAAIHEHASPAPVLTLLAHKAARAAAAEGGPSAQALLRDWLVLLTSARAHVDMPADPESAADARFRGSAGPGGQEGGLRPLPRLVFGLHRSALIGADPDTRACAAASLGFLAPLDLARALYPELTAWASVNEVVRPPPEEVDVHGRGGGLLEGGHDARGMAPTPPLLLPLTAAALACGPPLYLLDAHDALVVACVPGEDAATAPPPPFPPPRGSALRSAVEAARARRPGRAPRLCFVAGVDAAGAALAPFLVDDKGEQYGTPSPGGGGLSAFLAGVTEDARGLLREGAVV